VSISLKKRRSLPRALAPTCIANPNLDPQMNRERNVTFRNNWLLIALMLSVALVSLISSVGFAILALGQIFPWHGISLAQIFGFLSWSFSGWVSWVLGVAIWRLTIAMSHNQVRFDNEGAHFCFGPKKKTPEVYLAWSQIAAVRHQSVGNNQYYGVVPKDGEIMQFTFFTFFRAKKLAREIAARSGHSIEEV
jgi:hypothetical protein